MIRRRISQILVMQMFWRTCIPVKNVTKTTSNTEGKTAAHFFFAMGAGKCSDVGITIGEQLVVA